MMGRNVERDGKLARHLEEHIAYLSYSLVDDSLQQLRSQHHSLLLHHRKAKEEATLNAAALKRKVEENERLKERCEQLSRECELYYRDREVFSEAADDAEERRAEAELHMAEAERRAMDAEKRLEKAVCFIKLNFKGSLPDELTFALSTEDDHCNRRRTSFNQSSASSSSSTLPHSPLPHKPCKRSSLTTPKKEEDECKKSPFSSESKRRQLKQSPTNRITVLSNMMNHQSPLQPFNAFCNDTDQKALSPGEQNKEEDECKKSPFSSESKRRQLKQSPTNRRTVLSNMMNHQSPLQPFKAFCNDTDQKALSPGEQNKSQKIYDTSLQSSGKENMQFHSGDKKLRQAAKSDVERLKVEIGHLVSLLKNGQSYLSRAEVEAELIKAKNWELQALFKDKFSSFGVPSSEFSETGSGDGLEPSIDNNSRWLGVPKVSDSIISSFRKDKKPRVER